MATAAGPSFLLRFASYNVLAQTLAKSSFFPYVTEPSTLKWKQRLPRLCDTMRRLNADILSLSEVDGEPFQAEYKAFFAEEGYSTLFQQRSGKNYGNMLAWKESRFQLVRAAVIDLDDLAVAVAHQLPGTEEFNRASAARSDPLDIAQDFFRGCVGMYAALRERATQQVVIVAGSHLFWNPSFANVKAAQAAAVYLAGAEFMWAVAAEEERGKAAAAGGAAHGQPKPLPFILGGDWNSTPHSAAMAALYSIGTEEALQLQQATSAAVGGSIGVAAGAEGVLEASQQRVAQWNVLGSSGEADSSAGSAGSAGGSYAAKGGAAVAACELAVLKAAREAAYAAAAAAGASASAVASAMPSPSELLPEGRRLWLERLSRFVSEVYSHAREGDAEAPTWCARRERAGLVAVAAGDGRPSSSSRTWLRLRNAYSEAGRLGMNVGPVNHIQKRNQQKAAAGGAVGAGAGAAATVGGISLSNPSSAACVAAALGSAACITSSSASAGTGSGAAGGSVSQEEVLLDPFWKEEAATGPMHTTMTDSFAAAIDHILYTPGQRLLEGERLALGAAAASSATGQSYSFSLALQDVLPLPSKEEVQNGGLCKAAPTTQHPSDHFPLAADFLVSYHD